VFDGTLSRSIRVGSGLVSTGAGSDGGPAWRAGAAGALLGFALRPPEIGDGAITLMSGSTVWADAPDGAIDNPTAIARATTDARRPQLRVSRFFTAPPATLPHILTTSLNDSRLSVAGSSSKSRRELLATRSWGSECQGDAARSFTAMLISSGRLLAWSFCLS
jgi:hypothetical protein